MSTEIFTRPISYNYDVAIGQRPGAQVWNKFGYNLDVDTGAAEVLASFGGTYTPMATAEVLTISSTSADDDADPATGAQTITIVGVSGDNVPISETVALDGVTGVNTSNTWLGVNRIFVASAGTGGINAGTITATSATYGTQAEVPAGEGVTQQGIFTVPNGYTFITDWLWINTRKQAGGTAPRVTLKGSAYNRSTGVTLEVFRLDIDTAIENTIEINPSQPFNISQNSVLYFTATANANNTIVNIRFSGILKKNV